MDKHSKFMKMSKNLFNQFEVGGRVYDHIYNQVGVVYQKSDIAIQVAFTRNITKFDGMLKYARAYEAKHICENSRIQLFNEYEEKVDIEF